MAQTPDSTDAAPDQPGARMPPQSAVFPIVGIGASAGGLEAATRLFEHLPADTGMAFVLVQHLDPDHASQLAILIARITRLPVREAGDGMRAVPNEVYIIPPNADLTIARGVLRVLPRGDHTGLRLPIDMFLRALAEDQHERAIGVILSGTGSDGTQGLRAIKAAGGITFAQEAASAKYDGMPRSAIAAGAVDLVLTPEDIARELARIGGNPALRPGASAPARPATAEDGDGMSTIFSLLRGAHGIDFSSYKPATIERRIKRRMVLQRIERLDAYVRYLRANASERDALYQDLLIDVTRFFRDQEVFDALKRDVFPRLDQGNAPDAPIRVWVPGCATGEEAYSIAICLMEFFGEHTETRALQVFATDVNETALATARAGAYPEGIAHDVSPERLRRFFTRTEEGYRISKTIRNLCVFARQDITHEPPFSQLDLISCRNLLIYLSAPVQQRLIPVFHFALKPGGFLVLGTSETIGAAGDLFSLEDRKRKIHARKSTPIRLHIDVTPGRPPGDRAATPLLSSEQPWSELDLQREVDRVLLARYAPPAVVVGDALRIVQFRGGTGPYLDPLPGQASLDLLRLARGDLMLDLRTAINAARRDNTTVRKEGIRHSGGRQPRTTNVEVIPMTRTPSGERYFIVTFEDATPAQADAGATDADLEARSQVQIEALQQDLTATREYLQSIIEQQETTNEELRAAYEEIQSSNEELQSTNEELETAKEELQSTNEEITTVNEEMQNRNLELNQINNDLTNLLNVVNIPIVMVSNDLRIRRFTPMAEQVLSLIPGDVGRPLSDLRPKIDVPDLDRMIAEVIDTLVPQERDVQDSAGRWFSMRIRPYRTVENRIEGAVVVLLDVTEIKHYTLEVQTARDYAEAIVETVREPLIVLDRDLRVQTANRAFYAAFRVTPAETERQYVYAIGNGQWNIPELRRLLEQTLTDERSIHDFVVEHTFPHLGVLTMLINARKIVRKDESHFILMAIEDITNRAAG